jgi:nucleotide-binding universal stress UspA family protein
MRRVLVPLDGTSLAASILPDAIQLAGTNGTIILVFDPIDFIPGDATIDPAQESGIQGLAPDLEEQAELLRGKGVTVETHTPTMVDPAHAIDLAAIIYHADMIACATHGRSPLGRIIRGGIVWRALADSTVPVLVRHTEAPSWYHSIFKPEPQILVPLDGSDRAESALPLVQALASEWHASIRLVHVVGTYPITGLPHTAVDPHAETDEGAHRSASNYLDHITKRLDAHIHVQAEVLFGSVSETLVVAAQEWDVTHVVMTSHGRTGLTRAVLGSVADDLIQQLPCAIIVIPVLAARALEEHHPHVARR